MKMFKNPLPPPPTLLMVSYTIQRIPISVAQGSGLLRSEFRLVSGLFYCFIQSSLSFFWPRPLHSLFIFGERVLCLL